MAKFHITPKGQARECSAKTPEACKYSQQAGETVAHYASKEEAQEAYEQLMEEQTKSRALKKNNTLRDSNIMSLSDIADDGRIQDEFSNADKYFLKLSALENEYKKTISERSFYRERAAQSIKVGADIVLAGLKGKKLTDRIVGFDAEKNRIIFKPSDYKKHTKIYNDDGTVNHVSVSYDREKLRSHLNQSADIYHAQSEKIQTELDKVQQEFHQLTDSLVTKTGYAENPKYGVPTEQSTFEKYKNTRHRNYSSNPTKDVVILEKAEIICTECNNPLIKVSSTPTLTNYFVHKDNGSRNCTSLKDKGYVSTTASPGGKCIYCGTSNTRFLEFKVHAYSDSTTCHRCGGVDGYGIGD